MRAVRGLGVLLLASALAVVPSGCAGKQGSAASAYRPPPRQVPILDESISPKSCSGWMRGGLLATCDPVLLEHAWDSHELNGPGKLKVAISGRKLRVGGGPAVTQVIPADGRGEGLVPGSRVTLTGTLSAGSYLFFRAQSVTPQYVAFGEALFRDLGLAHGGTATMDVRLEHGKLVYDVRRPDGTKLKPLRTTLQAGPGAQGLLPQLPDHQADTPEQAVRTYARAINAHDGKTICGLLAPAARAAFRFERSPCWLLVSGHIGYGEESSTPRFQELGLLDVGGRRTRKNYGVTFTGIPIHVRLGYANTGPSEKNVVSLDDVVWFQRTKEGWRMGKASRTLYAAFSGSAPPDVLAPPDPLAALHQRQAAAKKKREDQLAYRRSLIAPAAKLLTCVGKKTTTMDPSGDTKIQPMEKSSRAAADRALIAGADLRGVSVAVSGHVACATVTFRHHPLRGRIGFSLSLGKRSEPPVAGDAIYVDFMPDGIHAGRFAGSSGALDPGGVELGIKRSRLSIRFQLSPRMPVIGQSQLGDLRWRVTVSASSDARTFQVSDELPMTKRGLSFAVRQSDGRIVKLY